MDSLLTGITFFIIIFLIYDYIRLKVNNQKLQRRLDLTERDLQYYLREERRTEGAVIENENEISIESEFELQLEDETEK